MTDETKVASEAEVVPEAWRPDQTQKEGGWRINHETLEAARKSNEFLYSTDLEGIEAAMLFTLSALTALGLAVVPVVPTEAMYDAGHIAIWKQADQGVGPQPGAVWAAMLAASPVQETRDAG